MFKKLHIHLSHHPVNVTFCLEEALNILLSNENQVNKHDEKTTTPSMHFPGGTMYKTYNYYCFTKPIYYLLHVCLGECIFIMECSMK